MNKTISLVKVRFSGQSNPGIFLAGDLPIEYGQKVVAMSERGLAIGHVNSDPFELPHSGNTENIRTIDKIATDEDIEKYKHIYQAQRDSSIIFNQLVNEHQLPMSLAQVEYASFGKKIIFYYTSPTRIDFRELLKSLSAKFKERIELRHIPTNENAESSGAIGPCGMELCLFIKSLMKDEASSKRGCSEFNCCLDYKDPFYEDKRSRLPKLGDFVTTHTGEMGRVERLDLWKEQFEMLTDQGVVKRYVSELLKDILNKRTVQFPRQFESISNETSTVIGLDKIENAKKTASEAESADNKILNKDFTEKNFERLFGEASLDYSLPEIDE